MKKKHQSLSLKQLALKNIRRKHKVILKWISDGIPYLVDDKDCFVRDSDGEKILDFYPDSLRKFYAWNGTQNCKSVQNKIGNIKGTGTTTLNKENILKEQISTDLETLKSKALIQLENKNKTSELQSVKNQLTLESMQRAAAEKKYLSMVLDHEKLKTSLYNEKRAKEQSMNQLTNTIAAKELEVAKLTASLSELRKSFGKITQLQAVEK